jgi:hypothetical protein
MLESSYDVKDVFEGKTPIDEVRERLRPYNGENIMIVLKHGELGHVHSGKSIVHGELREEIDGSFTVYGEFELRHRDREIAELITLTMDGEPLEEYPKYDSAELSIHKPSIAHMETIPLFGLDWGF